jgi:putative restriction endonuclease
VLAAALSFRTVYRPEGGERPYEDAVGPDGLIRYKYRGTDPDHPENRALRAVMHGARPLHQPIFRATVIRAYATRCAVCALGHARLLDAAHIVPDRDERGIAAVRNGMALCKIHHAALDSHILGVRPDYVVEIRPDLLQEVDGPMLRYGLQERHGEKLMVLPSQRSERPDRDLLELAYETFRRAG